MGKKKYLFKNDPGYLLMATTKMDFDSVKHIFKRMLYLNDLNDVYFVKDTELDYYHTYSKINGTELNFVVAPHTKYAYGIYGRKLNQ